MNLEVKPTFNLYIHHRFLSLNLEMIALALCAMMHCQQRTVQSHVIDAAWRHGPRAKPEDSAR